MKYSVLSGLAALASVGSAADLDPITIVGNKFFYKTNGSQFYIRGVAYQSNSLTNETSATSFNDPLADGSACKRDIPYLQKLNTNVVRVYAINSSLDHSECMNAFNDAGIYVISDLSEPGVSINRDDPSWNTALLSRYSSVVDALANYTNVLGFFAGNEVVNAPNNTNSAPFVKAAIRDTKAYIKQKNYRSIPIGYSASDDAAVRVPEADYFACGDSSEHADFYGVNMYEWCGDSTFQESGWADRTKEMQNMSIPLFFSEYGCNRVQPRKFQEVATLYSDDMTGVWSGGIVYMYFQEENDYGLVSVSGNSVSTLADFGYLSSALATISPSSAKTADQTQSTSVIGCPATSLTNWTAATSLPQSPDAGICDCLDDSTSCQISSDVNEDDYGNLFGYLCGVTSCNAINANGTTGNYGAFAGCSPKQQLNYILNQYYQQNGNSASACDFSGSATLKGSVSTASSCQAYFASVGSSGTGALSQGTSINAGNSGTKPTDNASASGSASASATSGSSSKKGSASSSGSSSSSSKSKNVAASNGNVGVAAGIFGGLFTLLVSFM